jgi:hypothetical protein
MALGLIVALCAAPGFAAPQPIARVDVGTAQVSWEPLVSYQKIVLTVSGPGGTLRREFEASQRPSFDLAELDNAADGAYTYELRIAPVLSAEVVKALRAARKSGDAAIVARLQKEGKLPEVAVQSGSFTVAGGTLVPADLREAPTAATGNARTGAGNLTPAIAEDDVIADDLIVQGSACVGLDCVSGESFGFDTIRLKENNTRIKFDDTSASTGFPANDWQLTANDSASGGANKFSIEDVTGSKVPFTVTAGAPTNSMFVDSTGRLGLRTATPVLDLHIATSNTPALRLEQNNSGGFTAQTWDIGANEANFFVRDVTGGSRLSFRIRPGAPTSSIDIASDGKVGIGTASPAAQLHVASGEVRFPPGSAAAAGNNTHFNFATDGKNYIRGTTIIADNGGLVGIGTASPANPLQMGSGAFVSAGGVWTNASSRDFKDEIQDLSAADAEKTLDGLNPVTYKYKNTENEHHVGFIAEDVPDLVAVEGRKSLSPMDIVAVLTKVVQDQKKAIEDLNAKVAELEKTAQANQAAQTSN